MQCQHKSKDQVDKNKIWAAVIFKSLQNFCWKLFLHYYKGHYIIKMYLQKEIFIVNDHLLLFW